MGRSNYYRGRGNNAGSHRRHNSDSNAADRVPLQWHPLQVNNGGQNGYDNGSQRPSSSRQQQNSGSAQRNYQYRGHQQQSSGQGQWPNVTRHQPVAGSLPIRTESDIPGYSFDPATGKYYAILDSSNWQPSGSTRSDLVELRLNYYRNEMLLHLEERRDEYVRRHALALPRLCAGMANGGGGGRQTVAERQVDEFRLRRIYQRANYTVHTNGAEEPLSGCQFLDVRQGGRMLVSCWGVDFGDHGQSRLLSHRIDVDVRAAQDVLQQRDADERRAEENGELPRISLHPPAGNGQGLHFEPSDRSIYINATLVDMAVAPADTDVTCILYATARSFMRQGAVRTHFGVQMRAIDALTPEETRETASAPIYNVNLSIKEPVWSCAFDANNLRIGVGMDKCAAIYNYLTNNIHFRVSSGGKNVIAQQFSKSGEEMFLARLCGNAVALDLRADHHQRTVGEFVGSWSTCFMHQMRNRPNHILTDNFEGKIRLFDTRTRRCVLEFNEHQNSSHKLPCFIDEEERFVFAVGEDGVARGWSLANGGDPLFQLVCPKSSDTRQTTDFPRVAYSPRWGGINGNAALVIATNGELSVHELTLDG